MTLFPILLSRFPFDIHQYRAFYLTVLVHCFGLWAALVIVSTVVSLHFGCHKAMDTFLEDYKMVLNAIQANGASSTKSKVNVKKTLIEAINVHRAMSR